MIQLESIHVEETRGIRNLDLHLGRSTFVVQGPNGSGKSGVVDAIQFALTGEIGRLQGPGSADLSLKQHGPHVDARDYPDASLVRLDVFIPSLDRSASITRWINKPRHPQIEPDTAEVRAVFEELARHRELTLARREIIRFILTEASERSKQVQALLKLDRLDDVRAALKTAENKLNQDWAAAKAKVESHKDSLRRHLDLEQLSIEPLLQKINPRRDVLGLPPIPELKPDTELTDGLAVGSAERTTTQVKESTLADLDALLAFANGDDAPAVAGAVQSAINSLREIHADAGLLASIEAQPLYELGLKLALGPTCPLCDRPWDLDLLRQHIAEKLTRTQRASELRSSLLESGRVISAAAQKVQGLTDLAVRVPEASEELRGQLTGWKGAIRSFAESLANVEGLQSHRDRLESGWAAVPARVPENLITLRKTVAGRPEQSALDQARDYLVVAQERLQNYQDSQREAAGKGAGAERGALAYRTYCDVSEAALERLYSRVVGDFASYYQLLNHDDEHDFKAKLVPSEGQLRLLVDFHRKGLFPPGAFHSEGHQDGMGVCLYLALLKEVLGGQFTFAVLDDVVMSVDSQHRRQFCRLLKTHFPETQFVITTHDLVWAQQMRSEGLVRKKNTVAFYSWTVETGPIIGEVEDAWEQVEADLRKNDVPAAAHRLRRHLEYVAADLADNLGAKVAYQRDAAYDMGSLMSAVIGRQRDLLEKARKAADSWGDSSQQAVIERLADRRKEILATKEQEQWLINRAVHYNEWANLSKEDFEPVVEAFHQLVDLFRCSSPSCSLQASITPRQEPIDLRCDCGAFRLNLKVK